MAYGYGPRNRASSVLDVFSLNPLPYPVLFFLALISIFLFFQWSSSYEEVVEATEQSLGWVLFVVPVMILIAARWLSTFDNPERWFFPSPYDRQRRAHHRPAAEGSSPWGVAAVIVLLLVLVQYQSTFHDSWFG